MSLLAQANTGTGTDKLDTDQSTGVEGFDHTGVIKIRMGTQGINEGLVSAANPLPVTSALPVGAALESTQLTVKNTLGTEGALPPSIPGTGAVGYLRAILDKVLGSLAVTAAALPLPAGASTEGTSALINTSLGADGAAPPALSGSGVRGWLRGIYEKLSAALTVTGTVAVSNFPATQAVSGAVSVSNLPATQAVSGTVAVSNLPATQAVSAVTLPLPTGAATEATLAAINTKLPTVGAKAASVSQPVALSLQDIVTGTATIAALNTDLLSGAVNGWVDVSQYRSVCFQIIGGAGIAAGAFTLEHTNDTTAGAAGNSLAYNELAIGSSAYLSGTTPLGANSLRTFSAAITAKFIRVRVTTALSGGTVQCIASFSQQPYANHVVGVTTTGNSIPVAFPSIPVLGALNGTSLSALSNTTFIASSAITATVLGAGTVGAAISSTSTGQFQSVTFGLAVTAVSGTLPTLDVVVQESYDNGATWDDVYHFPRVTAALSPALQSPPLVLRGTHYRVNRTVGGTAPSFTNAVLQVSRSVGVNRQVQFFDRAIAPATLGSATPYWLIEGTENITAFVSSVSATTPATYQLQVSMDKVNWVNVGTATASVAAGTVQFGVINIMAKYARIAVTTIGTAQVLNYAGVVAGGA